MSQTLTSPKSEQTTQKQSGQTENNNIFFLILNIGFIIILCILTIVNIVYYFIKNISKDRNQLDFLINFNPIDLIFDTDDQNNVTIKPVPKQNNFEIGNTIITGNDENSLIFKIDDENSTLKEGQFYKTGMFLNNLSKRQECYNSGIANGTPLYLNKYKYIKNSNGEFTDINYCIEFITINSSLYGSIIGPSVTS